jgi:hypothetical protein
LFYEFPKETTFINMCSVIMEPKKVEFQNFNFFISYLI